MAFHLLAVHSLAGHKSFIRIQNITQLLLDFRHADKGLQLFLSLIYEFLTTPLAVVGFFSVVFVTFFASHNLYGFLGVNIKFLFEDLDP